MNNYLADFLKFEHENDMFHKKIKDVNYWHIIRNFVYMNILVGKENIQTAHPFKKKKFFDYIIIILKLIKNIIEFNPFIKIKQSDILFFHAPRKIEGKNGYYSSMIDTFIDDLQYSYCILERPTNFEHQPYLMDRYIKYTDYIEVKRIISQMLNKKKCISKKDMVEVNSWCDILERIYNININRQIIYDRIINAVCSYKVCSKNYKKLLLKYKPKVIIEVCHYDIPCLIMNSIANELGVPIIELQHGTIGCNHESYNFYSKDFVSSYLPNYIFAFGQFWIDNTNFPSKEYKMIATGFPYYDQEVDKYKDFSKCNDKILVLSQGTIGQKLSELAIELSDLLKNHEYEIIYKLHPSEYNNWRNLYPKLSENNNIVVIDNNNKDLYEYFSICKYLIGVYSTAIYESLGFDINILIYKVPGYEYVKELYRDGYAEIVNDAEEILFYINGVNKNRCINKDYFWKENSKENIIKELESFMKRGE